MEATEDTSVRLIPPCLYVGAAKRASVWGFAFLCLCFVVVRFKWS